jgi:hypothetical protein
MICDWLEAQNQTKLLKAKAIVLLKQNKKRGHCLT